MLNYAASSKANELLKDIVHLGNYRGSTIQLFSNKQAPIALAYSIPIYSESKSPLVATPGLGLKPIGYNRIIVYNPILFASLDIAFKNKFPAISILAHEVGHHFHNHCDGKQRLDNFYCHPHDLELKADEFSGLILAKLKATPDELQMAQRYYINFYGTTSHPDTAIRIKHISDGFRAGGGVDVEYHIQELYNEFENDLKKWTE
jgi:hypothetical protein